MTAERHFLFALSNVRVSSERAIEMHLFSIFNFVISVDCFFRFDPTAKTVVITDYNQVYNCTTVGALTYDFICLCVSSSAHGQCHNLYTVAQACSVKPTTTTKPKPALTLPSSSSSSSPAPPQLPSTTTTEPTTTTTTTTTQVN